MTLLHPLLLAGLLAGCSGKDDLPPPPGAGGDQGGDSAAPADSDDPGDDDGAGDDGSSDDGSGDGGDDSDPGGDDGGDDTAPPAELSPPLSFTGARPTNLLLVSIDTLRRDDLGRWAGGDTSPWLDAWLEEAVVLDHHRSCANWTYPAMACALTGNYNADAGYLPTETNRFPDSATTLAEILKDAGYQTRLVASQALLDPEINLTQGYDHIQQGIGWDSDQVAPLALEQATEMLDEGGPWLLHIHLFDPHLPFNAPGSYRVGEEELPEIPYDLASGWTAANLEEEWEVMDEETRADVLLHLQMLYDAELRFLDEQIGLMFDELEGMGALEDTLVVFFSDHGEQYYEHNGFEHGVAVYTEETLALAGIQAPGLEPMVVDAVTSHVDLLPTILDALGREVPEGLSGSKLGDFAVDRPVFSAMFNDKGYAQAVEIGDDRLVYLWEGFAQYFDLATDHPEQVDLYDAEDPTVQALWEAMAPMTEAISTLSGETPRPVH